MRPCVGPLCVIGWYAVKLLGESFIKSQSTEVQAELLG